MQVSKVHIVVVLSTGAVDRVFGSRKDAEYYVERMGYGSKVEIISREVW